MSSKGLPFIQNRSCNIYHITNTRLLLVMSCYCEIIVTGRGKNSAISMMMMMMMMMILIII